MDTAEERDLRRRFNAELWPLNKSGNEETTFITLKSVHNKIFNAKKEVVTIDMITSKYRDYLAYWNSKFGKTEERFIGKDNKKKEIATFIACQDFNNDYNVEETPRDLYLFGPTDRKVLAKKTEEFLNRFKKKEKDGKPKSEEKVSTPEVSETKPF